MNEGNPDEKNGYRSTTALEDAQRIIKDQRDRISALEESTSSLRMRLTTLGVLFVLMPFALGIWSSRGLLFATRGDCHVVNHGAASSSTCPDTTPLHRDADAPCGSWGIGIQYFERDPYRNDCRRRRNIQNWGTFTCEEERHVLGYRGGFTCNAACWPRASSPSISTESPCSRTSSDSIGLFPLIF